MWLFPQYLVDDAPGHEESCTTHYECRLGMGYNIGNNHAGCYKGTCGCNSKNGYTIYENSRCYKKGNTY